jgi:hypothetical protein
MAILRLELKCIPAQPYSRLINTWRSHWLFEMVCVSSCLRRIIKEFFDLTRINVVMLADRLVDNSVLSQMNSVCALQC